MQDNTPMTDNERWILETLRTLKPFETIQITADKGGKINNFLVIRSSKVLLTDTGMIYTV